MKSLPSSVGRPPLNPTLGAGSIDTGNELEKDEKSSQSGDVPLVVMTKARLDEMMKVARMTRKGGKNGMSKPVPMRVTSRLTLTSGANSAYNTTQAITPLTYTDASSIIGLFDEMRVTSVEVWWRIETSAAPSGSKCAVLGWSPSSSDTLAAVDGALALQQMSGPVGVGLTLNPSPAAYTKTGMLFHRFKIKGPTPVLNPGTSSEIVAGGWFSSQDVNAVCGYLLPYVDAMGGSVTSTMTVLLRVNLECRART